MKKIKKILNIIIIYLKYVVIKAICYILKINKNKNIWLISERGKDARDNAYHMFKYIRKNHPEIDIRYIIDKKSADYEKVEKLGQVVQFNSLQHYILFLTSKILISTHIMGFSPEMSLFWRLQKKGKLKLKGKIVHLKHGITKDNLDFNGLKFDLFICGAYPEYNYITKTYKGLKNCAKYTGFARYDNLIKKESSNKILLMPTFRKWMNYYNDKKFIESNYYIQYERILNNPDIYALLEKYNYELIFYPHFQVQKRINLFYSCGERIKIASFNEYDVQQLLIDCDVLITDFSSIFFDFAYMRKPIIFYQFDLEEYRGNHYKEGYFNYERDGFGTIVYDFKNLYKELEIILKNKCILDKKYDNRIKGFFKYNDQKNCERIYNEITKL